MNAPTDFVFTTGLALATGDLEYRLTVGGHLVLSSASYTRTQQRTYVCNGEEGEVPAVVDVLLVGKSSCDASVCRVNACSGLRLTRCTCVLPKHHATAS